ncbi:hypothetical protein P879_06659 [Paragonimus westermani]|uniref:Uncharacterized protein n=1 Tax=Paragonimus westermani TaxID=34504 RepID=A0A8T0DHJ2_9TREM|nr:hypothetical protein P879_06659 [Paragonimus westermani]
MIPAVEEQLKLFPIDDANRARAQVDRIIKNQKSQPSNLSTKERDAFRKLRYDQSIIITKADKKNQVVILNKVDYERKAVDHISDGPYIMIPVEKQRSILNNSKASKATSLRKMKVSLGKSLWFTLYRKTALASRFYG